MSQLAFTLWFRPRHGVPWQAVASAHTSAELIGHCNGNGEFFTLPFGQVPENRRRREPKIFRTPPAEKKSP